MSRISKTSALILLILCILILFSSCTSSARYRSDTTTHTNKIYFQRGTVLQGKASYYGEKFHGQRTASGEIFDMHALTAAHRTLPFGTWIEVVNLKNNKSVVVKINDRGPFSSGRILDLSYQAAREIDLISSGVTEVKIKIIQMGKE